MHELAMAQQIADTLANHPDTGTEKITALHVEVGRFAGVVPDSLEWGLKLALGDNTTVHVTTVPASATCRCSTVYQLDDIMETCPDCGSPDRQITGGTGVIIRSVELED